MDFDLNIPWLDDFEACENESDNCTEPLTGQHGVANNVISEGLDSKVVEVEQSNDESRINVNSPLVSATNRDKSPGVEREETKSESICFQIEKRLAVGSVVDGFHQVYVLYCEYARSKGFSVRKGEQRYVGKSEEIRWKQYVCSSAGVPYSKSSTRRVAAYKKMVTRTGCKANIRVSRLVNGTWRITRFEATHNHELVPPEQTYLLRSSRNLSYAKIAVLEALHSVGIGVSRVCGFMERESGGPGNVGFIRQDAYDHVKLMNKTTKVENGDAAALLQYFIQKSNEAPFFYWKVQLDDDRRIMNFFFRDSQCADDYNAFGDVLSFDTTYRTNRYNLICAPFVGINHHTTNVMFGMAFMSDETTTSFEWLFRAFLESMNGVQPKVIFTDQCQAMMNAIDTIFPNCKHRLCQWHINQNAPSHFGSLNGNASFKKLWHQCMNGVESESEFEDVWSNMMNSYNLHDNKWFAGMYRLRHRWASVFSIGVFTAGLHATSRSELTNKVLKEMNRASSSLYDFVLKYQEIQLRWRRKEREEDTYCLWLPGQFVSDNGLLTHAATVYTRSIYKAFEYEVTKSFNVVVPHERHDVGGDNLEFSATNAMGTRSRRITYNRVNHVASCTCRMLETDGIFCRHILKVYYLMNVFALPQSCILKRWTKSAKDVCWVEKTGGETHSTLPYMLFLNNVMRQVYDMASSALNNDSARTLIVDRVEDLRRDVFAIVGLPGNPATDKMKSMANRGAEFCDPKPVRERGFTAARNSRRLDTPKRKVKNKRVMSAIGKRYKKKAKAVTATSHPNMPSNVIDRAVTVDDGDSLDCEDDGVNYWNFTQP